MKKKNLILFIAFIFLTLLFSSFLYFYYFVHPFRKPKYLTSIEELHSLFTEYMKNEVNSHLKSINCQSKEYYYDDSALCFICGEIHPCFGYGWVERGKSKKMNPKGIPYLIRWKEFNVKVGDFCEDGLASEFNCRKINKNSLECENIKFISTNKDNIFKCDEVKIFIGEKDKFKNFVNDFCSRRNGKPNYKTGTLVFCGNYIIELEENGEIIIGKK
jgi:hypothetical protein